MEKEKENYYTHSRKSNIKLKNEHVFNDSVNCFNGNKNYKEKIKKKKNIKNWAVSRKNQSEPSWIM